MNTIIQGDCLESLKKLEDNSIDSIVTDPPYGLSFMGKKWDYDVPSVEIWQECLRVLKPGGYLLSFAGTRTQHRMAVRIEDAGFEIRDMIAWVYGSGFPKSLNIGKAVDKLQGNEREYISTTVRTTHKKGTSYEWAGGNDTGICDYTKGTSEWEGWGTALKPALEPITVARKPLEKGLNVAENCLKWGTGGINIDESRVKIDLENEDRARSKNTIQKTSGISFNGNKTDTQNTPLYNLELGRFPANLIHDNSEEVRECFPESTSGARKAGFTNKDTGYEASSYEMRVKWDKDVPAEKGNASRFFKSIIYQAKASKSERNKGLDSIVLVDILRVWNENNTTKEEKLIRLMVTGISPQKVIAESGVQLKNANEWNTCLFGKHLMEKYQEDIKSITKTETNSITTSQTLNWLTHLLTNEYTVGANLEMENGGNLVENVENSNTLIITINEAMALALGVKDVVSGTQLKISVKEGSNIHSTVKPIALMEYLIKMVTREGGIVLDPFAGSGSTLIACKKLKRNYIGMELDPEYIKIAEARLNAIKEENTLF